MSDSLSRRSLRAAAASPAAAPRLAKPHESAPDDGAEREVPVVPMRGLVAFPGAVVPLFLGRARSIAALDALEHDLDAAPGESLLLLIAQCDDATEEPSGEELFKIGTLVRVLQSAAMPDGNRRLVVEGRCRARVCAWTSDATHLRARVCRLESVPEPSSATGGAASAPALVKQLKADFARIVAASKSVPPEALHGAETTFAPGPLADLIASHLDISCEERQEILECLAPVQRAQRVANLLTRALHGAELDREIDARVRDSFADGQREFLLRERMRIIQEQLGERDGMAREAHLLREKIEAAGLNGEALSVAQAEVARLERLPPAAPEAGIVRAYVEWLCTLPWHQRAPERLDLEHARRVLDDGHCGLEKVKERLIEFLAVRKLNPQGRAPILCFVGPPGVGKTSLGQSIADALGRPFARLSLGGLHDEAEIRGHRRTYVGALPGKIVAGLKRAGVKNPVFALDELDKLGEGRGDPASALLEVLDPEQNSAFRDHYLEVPFDLSEVLWIATANLIERVPPALRDRLEVVRLPGYTEGEKKSIARRHLLPRQRRDHGLEARHLSVSEPALQKLVRDYTREAGVRNLEREIATLCRKVARRRAEGGDAARVAVSPSNLEGFLGARRFSTGLMLPRDEIGIAQGLAFTECGGEVLPIEVTLTPGNGALKLTGNLGPVMRESCEAALTYARAHGTPWGADGDLARARDTHIHVPSGAVPKDGPSAGVAIAVAIISALSGRAVRREVAMSGEISLRGRVMAVGGVKEKVLAAHRAGAKEVVLPRDNGRDVDDVPAEVRDALQFHWADDLSDVLRVVLSDG